MTEPRTGIPQAPRIHDATDINKDITELRVRLEELQTRRNKTT
jgi:hypothetical protein